MNVPLLAHECSCCFPYTVVIALGEFSYAGSSQPPMLCKTCPCVTLRTAGYPFLTLTSLWCLGPVSSPFPVPAVSVKKWADWSLCTSGWACTGTWFLLKGCPEKWRSNFLAFIFGSRQMLKSAVCIAGWRWMNWAGFNMVISCVFMSLSCWMASQGLHWRNLLEHVTNWFAFGLYISLGGGDAIWGSYFACVFMMVWFTFLCFFPFPLVQKSSPTLRVSLWGLWFFLLLSVQV